MKIDKNKVVSILFTIKDKDGNELDSTGQTPFEYLHGHNHFLPKIEAELEGKEIGSAFTCSVEAGDAFGDVNETLIQTDIPKTAFEGVDEVKVGMSFEAKLGEDSHVIRITEVTEDTVTADANHELAGLDLVFEIEVIAVRDATEEEIPQTCESGCCGSSSCNNH